MAASKTITSLDPFSDKRNQAAFAELTRLFSAMALGWMPEKDIQLAFRGPNGEKITVLIWPQSVLTRVIPQWSLVKSNSDGKAVAGIWCYRDELRVWEMAFGTSISRPRKI